MQNKPQPEWASKITLNMVISLLTTLSWGFMMYVVASCISQLKWNYFTGRHRLFDFEVFDQASRGPMGAANFLARIPPSIASLGSLLTITALAISPFSQRVAKYRTEDVFKDDRGASFGVALEYTGTVNNGGDAPLSSSIDWKLQGGRAFTIWI